jgi:cytolysin-activating lysine-acyltransferase
MVSGVLFLKKSFELYTACKGPNVERKAKLLGFAGLVMFMCRRYSSFSMIALKFWIGPAIDHKQILFFFDKTSTPIGYVTWAHLASDSEERLLKDPDFLIHPSEWNEGGKTWIIDFCFPCGGAIEAVKQLKSYLREDNIESVSWARRNGDYTIRKTGSCYLYKLSHRTGRREI